MLTERRWSHSTFLDRFVINKRYQIVKSENNIQHFESQSF